MIKILKDQKYQKPLQTSHVFIKLWDGKFK